jgi:hypothetical protein
MELWLFPLDLNDRAGVALCHAPGPLFTVPKLPNTVLAVKLAI